MFPEYIVVCLNDLLKASPPLVLLFVLTLLGKLISATDWINVKHIPVYLCSLGAIIYPFVADRSQVSYNIPYPWVMNLILGAGMGGIAGLLFNSINFFKKRNE